MYKHILSAKRSSSRTARVRTTCLILLSMTDVAIVIFRQFCFCSCDVIWSLATNVDEFLVTSRDFLSSFAYISSIRTGIGFN